MKVIYIVQLPGSSTAWFKNKLRGKMISSEMRQFRKKVKTAQ